MKDLSTAPWRHGAVAIAEQAGIRALLAHPIDAEAVIAANLLPPAQNPWA
jgi:hypothetical protein